MEKGEEEVTMYALTISFNITKEINFLRFAFKKMAVHNLSSHAYSKDNGSCKHESPEVALHPPSCPV